MSTITYKNQPGIHATRGTVPLAGTRHVYTVGKILWPEEVTEFLKTLFIGKVLHPCCGKSQLGDIRTDMYEKADVIADSGCLPFADRSFDTVLCDPPYNGSFKWNHKLLEELTRVAKQRVIFQHWFMPINPDGTYKKWRDNWALSAVYVWQPRTYFGRVQVISVIDWG